MEDHSKLKLNTTSKITEPPEVSKEIALNARPPLEMLDSALLEPSKNASDAHLQNPIIPDTKTSTTTSTRVVPSQIAQDLLQVMQDTSTLPTTDTPTKQHVGIWSTIAIGIRKALSELNMDLVSFTVFSISYYLAMLVYTYMLHGYLVGTFYKSTDTIERRLFVASVIVTGLTSLFALVFSTVWISIVGKKATPVKRSALILSSLGFICGFVIVISALRVNPFIINKLEQEFKKTEMDDGEEYIPWLNFTMQLCTIIASLGMIIIKKVR